MVYFLSLMSSYFSRSFSFFHCTSAFSPYDAVNFLNFLIIFYLLIHKKKSSCISCSVLVAVVSSMSAGKFCFIFVVFGYMSGCSNIFLSQIIC